MANQNVSPVQIQMAASAGVELLNIKDLPVPMSIAKSGALAILEGMLGAVARGELVLTPPQEAKDDGSEGGPDLSVVGKNEEGHSGD